MNIEQMKYIVEVVKQRSITKAAIKLQVSSSAISQSISQLENEMKIIIFERSRKGMLPTLEGNLIISKSYEVLKKIQELHEELSLQKNIYKKVLKVACAPAMTYIVHDAFLLFNPIFEDINVIIEEMDQDKILEEIKNENFDIGFAPFSKDELESVHYTNGMEYELIYTGYLCVCVNKQSDLANQAFIKPDDLKDEKMVMYNSNRGEICNEKQLNNKQIFFTSNNIEVLRSAIINGHAFMLVYNFTFKNNPDVLNGKLAIIPFYKPDTIYQDFWALYPLTKGLSREAKEFQKKVIQLLIE